MRIRMGCTVARRIADILLQLFVLVLTGFLLLVLVDLRGRYDPKITAVDSNRVNERNLALKRGFTSHPKNGAGAGAAHARQTAVGSGELGPAQVLQEASKLPDGPHAAGTSNQGMSVRYPRTAIPLSLAGLAPTMPIVVARRSSPLPGRHGYSPGAEVRGYSKAVSWLARPAPLEDVVPRRLCSAIG